MIGPDRQGRPLIGLLRLADVLKHTVSINVEETLLWVFSYLFFGGGVAENVDYQNSSELWAEFCE